MGFKGVHKWKKVGNHWFRALRRATNSQMALEPASKKRNLFIRTAWLVFTPAARITIFAFFMLCPIPIVSFPITVSKDQSLKLTPLPGDACRLLIIYSLTSEGFRPCTRRKCGW